MKGKINGSLIYILVVIAVFAVYINFAFKPLLNNINETRNEITEKKELLLRVDPKNKTLIEKDIEKNNEKIKKLDEKTKGSDLYVEEQIVKAAKAHGVDVTKIDVSATIIPTGEYEANLKKIPVTFTFVCNASNVASFIKSLEENSGGTFSISIINGVHTNATVTYTATANYYTLK